MADQNAGRLFGTDGIRGKANNGFLTADLALKVGQAAGTAFMKGDHRHRVVIGKDTRLSSYMYENALTAGFLSAGMDVRLTGPVPTPGLARLVRSMRADLGVMVTASHNSHEYNGIKLFGSDGYKLSNDAERRIEELVRDPALSSLMVPPHLLGRAKRVEGLAGRYLEFVKSSIPKDTEFAGMRVVIDCAHGAGYVVAPEALTELGAEVIPMGTSPDGFNINADCGSTAPRALQQKVKEVRANIGIALDGDADRVVMVDERGNLIDGDQLLAVIADSWLKEGKLKGQCVVGTVLSNLAFERFLNDRGLVLERSPVGDRHVLEHMRATSSNLGGEQSGHIIMSDYTTSGDGLIAALQILTVIRGEGKKASEVCNRFIPVPQFSLNVQKKAGVNPLEDASVQRMIKRGHRSLGNGRLVVRNSGTEPVVRIMAEGEDRALLEKVVKSIAEAVQKAG
jgi:phosphoglucosamine mutase